MRHAMRIALAMPLGVGVVLALSPLRAMADPIVAGDDVFQSTGQFDVEIFDPFFPGGFVETIFLDSLGVPATVHRDLQVGDNPGTIDTEIVSLDLFGVSVNIGAVHVRVGAGNGVPVVEGASLGQITGVFTTGGSSLPSAFLFGTSFFNVLFEIDAAGNTFYNNNPHVLGPQFITELPPVTTYNSPQITPLFLDVGILGDHSDDIQVGLVGPLKHVTPEPSTLFLLGAALAGLIGVGMRRKWLATKP